MTCLVCSNTEISGGSWHNPPGGRDKYRKADRGCAGCKRGRAILCPADRDRFVWTHRREISRGEFHGLAGLRLSGMDAILASVLVGKAFFPFAELEFGDIGVRFLSLA